MDVTKIPAIMRAQKPAWGNAAALMERWFAAALAVYPKVGPPDTATIKMDSWLLTFPRARKVFDHKIVAAQYWATPKAQASLVDVLKGLGHFAGRGMKFGNFGRPVEAQDKEYFQSLAVDSSLTTDPLDDLFGALAAYNLHLVAEGESMALGGTDYQVRVDRVGVYVQDKYDFNGWQPLGYWRADDNSVTKLPRPGSDPVGNEDFRIWRDNHKKGGDFLVFSDVKVHTLSVPLLINTTGDPMLAGPPSPPKPPPAPAPSGTAVTVRRGDTLSGLAQKHYGDWQLWPLIHDANRTTIGGNPNLLKPGWTLRLPALASTSPARQQGAKRRAPSWKNSEIK